MCEFRCESGWLPVDGIPDCVRNFDGVHDLLMLEPTEYRPCFTCNGLSSNNTDLKGVVIDG